MLYSNNPSHSDIDLVFIGREVIGYPKPCSKWFSTRCVLPLRERRLARCRKGWAPKESAQSRMTLLQPVLAQQRTVCDTKDQWNRFIYLVDLLRFHGPEWLFRFRISGCTAVKFDEFLTEVYTGESVERGFSAQISPRKCRILTHRIVKIFPIEYINDIEEPFKNRSSLALVHSVFHDRLTPWQKEKSG